MCLRDLALGITLSQFDVQTSTTGYMTSTGHVFTPSGNSQSIEPPCNAAVVISAAHIVSAV